MIDKKKLLNSIRELPIESCRNLKSLHNLAACTHFCDILSMIHHIPIHQISNPVQFLEQHLPILLKPKLKSLNLQNICEIAEFLLLKIPAKVPKLTLLPSNFNSIATSCTHRSYLSSYIYKTTSRNNTPQLQRKKQTPDILKWAFSLGYSGDALNQAREGNLYCIIINLIEKRKVIKGYFDPAKTMSAVRSNFHKTFKYLKEVLEIDSEFYNEREIKLGNENVILGLLRDIRSYYTFRTQMIQEKENITEFHFYQELDLFGIPHPHMVKPLEIGGYLIKLIENIYKVCIPKTLPCISQENSKQNLQKFYSELKNLNPALSLKYSNKLKDLPNSPLLLEQLVQDILDSKYKPISGPTDSLLCWLHSLGLARSHKSLSEVIPRVKTGQLISEIAEIVTNETLQCEEGTNKIQCLENIQTALEVMFSHGLIPYEVKNMCHELGQGDIIALTSVLQTIRSRFGDITQGKPREYKCKIPVYRSVTPCNL